jgi:hypothetical protein
MIIPTREILLKLLNSKIAMNQIPTRKVGQRKNDGRSEVSIIFL